MGLMFIAPAIRIASKLARIGMRYKYLDINKKFIRKYVPPGYRRQAEIITDVAIGGSIISEIGMMVYDEFKKRPSASTGQVGKGRGYIQQPSFGRKQYGQYRRNYRRKCPDNRRSS